MSSIGGWAASTCTVLQHAQLAWKNCLPSYQVSVSNVDALSTAQDPCIHRLGSERVRWAQHLLDHLNRPWYPHGIMAGTQWSLQVSCSIMDALPDANNHCVWFSDSLIRIVRRVRQTRSMHRTRLYQVTQPDAVSRSCDSSTATACFVVRAAYRSAAEFTLQRHKSRHDVVEAPRAQCTDTGSSSFSWYWFR